MSDAEILAELVGYECWTPEISVLAEEASARRVLQAAYSFAHARYFAGAQSSSNSSVTFLVADGPMQMRANPNFCDLLRQELLAALGRLG